MRAPEVDLKCKRILAPRVALDHPLQWRVGNKAAIPVLLAVDFDGRKAGRQCPARHDMLGGNLLSAGVEIDKIAGPDIDCAGAEARHSSIKTIKIHQALERLPEVLGIVEAGRSHRAARLQPGHHSPRREKPSCAERGSQTSAHLIEEIARVVASGEINEWVA